MKHLMTTLFILLTIAASMSAQCDLKVNKAATEGKAHKKHVETHSDLLHSSKDGIVYSGISNFYDGTPQFKVMLCLQGDHYSISKDHDVPFNPKSGTSFTRKNLIRTGAKKTAIGSGSYRCATYTVPIDDELKAAFLQNNKASALESIEMSHKLGKSSFKIKKKQRNLMSDHLRCVQDILVKN